MSMVDAWGSHSAITPAAKRKRSEAAASTIDILILSMFDKEFAGFCVDKA